jgi:hypothetical protein
VSSLERFKQKNKHNHHEIRSNNVLLTHSSILLDQLENSTNPALCSFLVEFYTVVFAKCLCFSLRVVLFAVI